MESLDILVFSLAAFMGNAGVGVTGFGMAIIYLFVWQLAVVLGHNSNFKYAVFIQALALLSVQPLLFYEADVFKNALSRILWYFIPITVAATPLGQLLSDNVSTHTIQAVAGVLVTFMALFEVYQKRELFSSLFWSICRCSASSSTSAEKMPEMQKKPETREMKEEEEVTASSTENGHFEDLTRLDSKLSAHYTLKTILAKSPLAVVKSGVSKLSGNRVAIKSIVKAELVLEDSEWKVMEEIKIMRELQHPNILALHAVYDEPEHFHLVMDLMDGGDLLARLAVSSTFTEKYSRFVCQSILDALSHMHSKKIAHRDLKPENVLLASDREDSSVKLADFGFAKKELTPNTFTTLCGTPAYVAPEIIESRPYGLSCDMWSLGVMAFAMMGGYQPFFGETEEEVQRKIKTGDYSFDNEYFKHVAPASKAFIDALLVVDPECRLRSSVALDHPWFKLHMIKNGASNAVETISQVFFMIGSQRSGSNWLRTMLDEREDLAGPHPPHIMREFSPLLDRYGDLSLNVNFRILVDHVSTFVERNQVPWTDKHGNPIVFPRLAIFDAALVSSKRIIEQRQVLLNPVPLSSSMYLLCVFDAIMNFFTEANGKHIWMCKSMGMSKFHDILLEYYGPKRLRYIYLIRDPRDVAMSFMKTPVGDCHYYSIVKKWTDLQRYAMRIQDECPDLILKVHYEDILKEKTKVVKGIYEFIGERRFGGIKRQASVMFMNPSEDIINSAKSGREAMKARHLSYQFKNLGRGDSFAKEQLSKWRDPVNGLTLDAIAMVESIAYEVMGHFRYTTHLVGVTMEPIQYSRDQIAEFIRFNQGSIDKMNEDLKIDNPDDYQRRQHQAAALDLPMGLVGDWSQGDDSMSSPKDISEHILSKEQLETRLTSSPSGISAFECGRTFRYASATQRGYYPNEHDKPNQDRVELRMDIGLTSTGQTVHYCGCFDGHGPDGHLCAQVASALIPSIITKDVENVTCCRKLLEKSYYLVHEAILQDDSIRDELSGTTAVSVLMYSNAKCLISNVGDSTCIGGFVNSDGTFSTKRLCFDHVPSRVDELERITEAGGVVMTIEEREGLVAASGHGFDPAALRVWSPCPDKFPGCGFTRSLGDSIAHTLGVTACPEIFDFNVDANDRVLIVATDGVTEFLTDEDCLNIVYQHPMDPSAAARALVKAASKPWLDRGDYMDDITAAVIFFDPPLDKLDIEAASEPGKLEDSKSNSDQPLTAGGRLWTLFAGFTSGFLGGLCGIPGPSIILFFLHPPKGVIFTKKSQRATGTAITGTNVLVRVVYYLMNTFASHGSSNFRRDDWSLYVSVICFSVLGVFIGSKIFDLMKDNTSTIRAILTILLLVCGVSLLISSYSGK